MRLTTVLCCLCLTALSRAGELIANREMAPPFTNSLAYGWRNNCWGKNTETGPTARTF